MKISYDEYQRLSFLIVATMKEFDAQGTEHVMQCDLINRMVQKLEVENADASTSMEKSIETSKKVSNVISHLITREHVLMISQDSRVKNDRYLTLAISEQMGNLSLGKQ